MQVAVLASGSRGNATFIEMEGVRILVDAGISTRRIKQELSGIGEDIADIDAIFITHEHVDHINGLTTMTKKYGTALYSRPDTFRSMKCYENLPQDCINPIIDQVRLGRVSVRAFDISHDAANPVGYVIQGSCRCVVATDIGFMTPTIQNALEGAQVAVLEANHDVDMVRNGDYPRSLKQRILGKQGHLSNRETGLTLTRLKQPPQQVFLAHLSEANNRPSLAMATVQDILTQKGLNQIKLYMTAQNQCVSIKY